MKIKSLLILLTLCSTLLLGQDFKTDSISKLELSKLEFLIGEWEGEGWIMGRDKQKHAFQQTENIQFKIDGVAILIEGLGKSNGQITNNSLAIISYNKKDRNYTFQSIVVRLNSFSDNIFIYRGVFLTTYFNILITKWFSNYHTLN